MLHTVSIMSACQLLEKGSVSEKEDSSSSLDNNDDYDADNNDSKTDVTDKDVILVIMTVF